MIPKGLFTQIGMVIVSVAIIITYVQPAFSELGTVQDSIGVYQSERKQVASVNAQLASLLSRLDSVSNTDQRKLLTYLPDSVDEISVQRDLLLISNESGVLYKNSSYSGSSDTKSKQSVNETDLSPSAHSFNLSVVGTYGQLKNLFQLLGQNHYPLEVHGVTITRLEGDFLSADIRLTTYTYQSLVTNNEVIF